MTRIGITGGTRPNRNGEQVARRVYDITAQRDDADFEAIKGAVILVSELIGVLIPRIRAAPGCPDMPNHSRRPAAPAPPPTSMEVLMCQHQPPCPPADAVDRGAARVLISHPEQGWSLLCNGTVMFEDTGALLPGGQSVPPHRPAVPKLSAAPPAAPAAASDSTPGLDYASVPRPTRPCHPPGRYAAAASGRGPAAKSRPGPDAVRGPARAA